MDEEALESRFIDMEMSLLSRMTELEDKLDDILKELKKQQKPLDVMENHVYFVESVGQRLFPFGSMWGGWRSWLGAPGRLLLKNAPSEIRTSYKTAD